MIRIDKEKDRPLDESLAQSQKGYRPGRWCVRGLVTLQRITATPLAVGTNDTLLSPT